MSTNFKTFIKQTNWGRKERVLQFQNKTGVLRLNLLMIFNVNFYLRFIYYANYKYMIQKSFEKK